MEQDFESEVPRGRKRSGAELQEILRAVEETLGQELNYEELTELVRAAERES